MVIISMQQHMAYPWLQFVHIHHPNMHCHTRFFFISCSNSPHIDLPGQESDRNHSNTYPSIRFHIYRLIARCTVHGRRPLDERKFFYLCLQHLDSVTSANICARKELAVRETYIADFHTNFYITTMQNIEFYLPHIRILGTNHCGNTRH